MENGVYSFFTDGLEVYNILKAAKAAGKEVELQVENFGSVTTLKSTDVASVWQEYFHCKTEADIVDRFVSKPKLKEKEEVMARAQFLERQFEECKYDIYPQRAQEYMDYLAGGEEFDLNFKYHYIDRVQSYDKPNIDFPMRSAKMFSNLSKRSEGYPDRYMLEIRREVVDRRGSKFALDKFYNKETIFRELITFYPGGAEIVYRQDPNFLESHPELAAVMAENQKFDREIAAGRVDPAIEEMPTDKAREQVKQITKGELDYLASNGYAAQFRTDSSQMDVDEVFDILREGKKTGTPIRINGVSCDQPEDEWYKPITGHDKEEYLWTVERKKEADAELARIKAEYVDTMVDEIYPQRFAMWQKFVDMYTNHNDWGKPVTISPFIEYMTKAMPVVNSGSALKTKKLAHDIKEIDGPRSTASVVNLMLFAKKGPAFAEKNFEYITSIESQQAALNRIKAENQKFEAESAQEKQR